MTVLYMNTNPRNRLSDAAGYATHMAKTIRGFEEAGHRVAAFLAADAVSDAARETYRGMRRRVPEGLARLIRDLYELAHDRRFYRANLLPARAARPDFIYERANAFHTAGLRMARRLGIPLVYEINDPLRESVTVGFSALKPIAVAREDAHMREADLVVVGSQALRSHYQARGFDGEKILVLYPTADEKLFSPTVNGRLVRSRYDLDGAPVAGLVASMAPWHRVDLFQDALARLGGSGVRGMLVGEIREPAEQGSRQPAALIRAGRVPSVDVPAYIAAMDICVIANATWYGSPTKLFEYAAMGKPVVAPRFAPIEEIIEDGKSGLLFTPGSAEELAGAIHHLARDESLRLRLAGALHRRVVGELSWKENTRKIIERVAARSERGNHH